MSSGDIPFATVVIIGAERSGTNALRDMLTCLLEFTTWNFDKIPTNRATPRIRRFLPAAFLRLWHHSDQLHFVVEKTCANTLPVLFVDAILPAALYVRICNGQSRSKSPAVLVSTHRQSKERVMAC